MKNIIGNKKTAVRLIVGCAVIAALLIFAFSGGKENGETASDSLLRNNSSQFEEREPKKSEFKEIVFDLPNTMQEQKDYWNLSIAEFVDRDRESVLKLEPVVDENGNQDTYYLGHKLYHSPTKNEDFIYSGHFIYCVSKDTYDNGNGYVREEDTGRRIHMFQNSTDLEKFKAEWEEGQKVFAGGGQAPENAIIFDGCLTDLKYETDDNGKIFVNLRDLLPRISPQHVYDPDTDGYMKIFVNEYTSVTVPTSNTPAKVAEVLKLSGDKFEFRSWNGPSFSAWCGVPDAGKPMVSIEDCAVMFGWRFFTDGETLSIETDPLNANSLCAVTLKGDLGIEAVIEDDPDGSRWIRAYNKSGDLVWEKPFVAESVEEAEVSSSAVSDEVETE